MRIKFFLISIILLSLYGAEASSCTSFLKMLQDKEMISRPKSDALNPRGWESRYGGVAFGKRQPTDEEQKLIDKHVNGFLKMMEEGGLTLPEGLKVMVATSGDSHYKPDTNEIVLVLGPHGEIKTETLAHELGHSLFEKNTSLPILLMDRDSSWQAGFEELLADVASVLYTNSLEDSGFRGTGYGRSFKKDWKLEGWSEHEEHGLFGPTRSHLGRTVLKDVGKYSDVEKAKIFRQMIEITTREEQALLDQTKDTLYDLSLTPEDLNRRLIDQCSNATFL